jgi:hypothetical protein
METIDVKENIETQSTENKDNADNKQSKLNVSAENFIEDMFKDDSVIFDSRVKTQEKDKLSNKKNIKENTAETKNSDTESLEKVNKTQEIPAKKENKSTDLEDIDTIRQSLKKEKDRADHSNKWGRDLSRKLSNANSLIKKWEESAVIDEEQAAAIINVLKHGHLVEDDIELSPMDKHIRNADSAIMDMRRYSDDELFDKKITYFNSALKEMSEDEMADLIDELDEIEDDPVKLLKRMMAIGYEYYNNSPLKEVEENGGIKEVISSYKEKINLLQKKLDKQDKIINKLKEEEDYDKSSAGYDIPYGSYGSQKEGGSKKIDAEDFIESLHSSSRRR